MRRLALFAGIAGLGFIVWGQLMPMLGMNPVASDSHHLDNVKMIALLSFVGAVLLIRGQRK